MQLSPEERKRLQKQRRMAAKEAAKYHKEREKQEKENNNRTKKQRKLNQERDKRKKSSEVPSNSKIKDAVNANRRKRKREENLTREEKFRRRSEEKIRHLEPQDFEDGFYIDEYGERKKQERRAKEIHDQENEVIHRRKKLLTSSQVKRRRILIYSGIFSVVLIVGMILCLTVLFKTENIIVEGDKYYSDEQIIAFCGVEKQQNIFVAVMSSSSDKAVENLPYIEQADVSFSIPDTVIIKVKNAVPSYVIKNGNNYLLVSAKGRILQENTDNKDKLPVLKCDELKSSEVGKYVSFKNENIPEILQEISESLNKNKVKKITGFDVTDTSNITLDYDNRIKINIGLPADIDYKIRTAITIINEKLDPNNTGTISGTLDVSACNTTRVSHYKPNAETQPSTSETQPSSTSSTDATTNDYGTYDWNSSGYDSNSYGNSTYGDGTYDGYSSYDTNTYDYGGYGDNTYDYGYDANSYYNSYN